MIADITFHPKWWNKKANVEFDEKFFFDAHYRMEADIDMRRVLYDKFGYLGLGDKKPDPRPLLGTNLLASGFLYSEILGCDVKYYKDNPPDVIPRNLSGEETLNLKVPVLDENIAWQKIERNIKELQKEFGYVESYINLQGIQNIALDIRGIALFMDYYLNPELIRHLLGVCTKLSAEIGTRLKKISKNISGGVTAVADKTCPGVYLTSNCSVEMITNDIYEEFLLEYDNMLATKFEPFGIHHCGASMEHLAEGYSKVRNLKFLEVGAGSDILKIRSTFPDKHLNLRYSPVKLVELSSSELKKDITNMAQKGGDKKLTSMSCVGVDDTVSDDKVRAFLETVINL